MALKIQSLLLTWKELDLHNTQQSIDETATELTAKQDESDVSRKKLVEAIKEFKKNVPEDVRKQAAPIIKSFQTEIDNLTRRCKVADSAFLKVYKILVDIADPVPALEYCIGLEKKLGKYADLEIENKNLRETLSEYNEEFKEIRNQDVTIKNLREKLKSYEDNLSESVTSKIKEAEKELQEQYSEKERLLQEVQAGAIRRMEEAEAKTRTLQHTLEVTQSQLFEHRGKVEELLAAHSEEVNILADDLDRANHRAMQAEKDAARLREMLENAAKKMSDEPATVSQIDADAEMLARSSLEVELSIKDKEVVQLVQEVKKLQAGYKQVRDETETKINNLETKLAEKSMLVDDLQKILDEQKDYQEVKRELAIVKSVEFGSCSETDDWKRESAHDSRPLELLLMEKNKSLQNENTILKKANLDLTKLISESNQEVSSLRTLTSEQKCLIGQLESDLASMQSFSSVYRGEGEGCPSAPQIIAEAVRGSSVTSAPAGGEHDGAAADVTSILDEELDQTSTSESLLSIVSAQRERFRSRNDELEAELTAKNQQVTLLQNELDVLRSDNVKLYEKIRFLQSYRNEHTSNVTNAESRYSNQYEESLDPFLSFSRQERLRRYSALTPFEKMTLAFGRSVLSNKTARTVTFIYTALVHCLVFMVLYKLAHTESCKNDISLDCAERFAEHMHREHNLDDFNG
ncbi:hypothetical protein HAZT_HAZT000714 [Hyalella azteca]|uniref:Protein CASP n=1 Tax=Hyalella azteca TaxID=294128 RepID=A0A6A0HDF8_HYAAZ|nr:protein CASP [Hyalella azteca]KAA0203850.1 hypothetical protein HAZT_HAZT000714 [Hyalella azteca]